MTQPPYGDQSQPLPPLGQPQPGWPTPPVAAGWPPAVPPAAKKRRGLLITMIVLGLALLLCGGGGTAAWFLLRKADGTGAQSPSVAVNDFLVAVYSEGDVARASRLVCRESRRRADIQKKVDQLRRYERDHKSPRFSWSDPTVSDEQADRAQVAVTVKITTEDEQTAEESLHFTVVKRSGWFVCEVKSG